MCDACEMSVGIRPLSTEVANQLRERYDRPPDVPNREDLLWVGVDLDGTLADPIWTPSNPTSAIGDPIWPNIHKAREVARAGYKIIIHTSRPWMDYERIETWLKHYAVPFKDIQCGKPLYILYVDDRARHADAESWLP
jgi:hypothetical protein